MDNLVPTVAMLLAYIIARLDGTSGPGVCVSVCVCVWVFFSLSVLRLECKLVGSDTPACVFSFYERIDT